MLVCFAFKYADNKRDTIHPSNVRSIWSRLDLNPFVSFLGSGPFTQLSNLSNLFRFFEIAP